MIRATIWQLSSGETIQLNKDGVHVCAVCLEPTGIQEQRHKKPSESHRFQFGGRCTVCGYIVHIGGCMSLGRPWIGWIGIRNQVKYPYVCVVCDEDVI